MSRRIGFVAGATLVVLVLVAVAFRMADTESSGAPSESATSSPSPEPTPSATPDPGHLLPNMRSIGAGDLRVEAHPDGRRLRFAASLGNLGPGPMLVRPRRDTGDCPPGQLRTVQLVHVDGNDSGAFERSRDPVADRLPGGCMLDHRGHDHWHFDAMAQYSLRRPGTDQPVARRPKVSFCLRDNERIAGQPVVVRREYFGECTRTGPQGISPGWTDIYKSDLDGQWLWLPRSTRDEALCLDLEADPRDLLEETDEADNATTVAIRVTGREVRRANPQHCV